MVVVFIFVFIVIIMNLNGFGFVFDIIWFVDLICLDIFKGVFILGMIFLFVWGFGYVG